MSLVLINVYIYIKKVCIDNLCGTFMKVYLQKKDKLSICKAIEKEGNRQEDK